jgi:hypothetical protein
VQCGGLILNANGDPARFAFGLPVIPMASPIFPGRRDPRGARLGCANRPDVAHSRTDAVPAICFTARHLKQECRACRRRPMDVDPVIDERRLARASPRAVVEDVRKSTAGPRAKLATVTGRSHRSIRSSPTPWTTSLK